MGRLSRFVSEYEVAAEQNVFALVLEFFGGDEAKAWLWMEEPNPMLGQMSPLDLLHIGRGEFLLRTVEYQLWENGNAD
jgi:uncharacterized protein (DUF2384 family)